MDTVSLFPTHDQRPNTHQSIQITVKQVLFPTEAGREGDENWLKFTQFKH